MASDTQKKSLELAAKAKLELLRRKAWDDLYFFTKFVCGRDLLEEIPHREVCNFLMKGLHNWDMHGTPVMRFTPQPCNDGSTLNKKLLMLPRNSFKSTIVTNAFPVWLLWHNPNLRIMIDSETLANAKLYLSGIKDLIENNELLKLICADEEGNYLLEPNKKIPGGFTEESVILLHRTKLGLKEPSIFCSGVDNARTGMHPDVIIMDDLVSERNVSTQGQIEKVKDHYKYSLSLLEVGGLLQTVGTRYHYADLYGELIENPTIDKFIKPAILSNGRLFFPSRLSKEFLEQQKKDQGVYIFNCQYLLNPINDSDATFKKAWVQYYEKIPPLAAKYILVDLAISQKQTADYTVIMTVGVTFDKKLYLIEYDRGRFNPTETIDKIFSMFEKHRDHVRQVGIETVAYQKAMIYLLKDEMRRRGTYIRLAELKADKDKVRRINSLVPLFENGDVFIKYEHKEFENELLEFPYGKHDDTIDAFAYILQLLKPTARNIQTSPYMYRPANPITGY